MPGKKAAYGAQKHVSCLTAASTRPCEPLALIPVSGKKMKSGGEIRTKNGCSARPWGRRAVTLVSESFILVYNTGHSASVLRDSAVYVLANFFFF